MSQEKELDFKECMKEILSLGGDTDTNACIAGSMIGSIIGFKNLDYQMVKTVL